MYKPYLDYNQQIQKLVSQKGLVISDFDYARQKLIDIGYFSLIGGYKTPFINPMTRKKEDFNIYKKNLRNIIKSYLENSHRLPETDLLNIMGFPSNWNHITRYRL